MGRVIEHVMPPQPCSRGRLELPDLVVQAGLGDVRAVAALVRRFGPTACAYAMSILHDWHSAEDAAQEAFVDACRGLRDLREPHAFPAWLRRIVFKHCDRIRRRTRPTMLLDERSIAAPAEGDPAAIAERRADRRCLLDAIRALPAKQGEAIALYYLDGMRQGDMASLLGVPLTTVKKRLHDAKVGLRVALNGRTGW